MVKCARFRRSTLVDLRGLLLVTRRLGSLLLCTDREQIVTFPLKVPELSMKQHFQAGD